MSWVAVGVAGASLVSGYLGADAADDAADAQTRSSQQGIQEQRRQFDLARSDLAPYRAIGTQALNALGSIYGYTPYNPNAIAPSSSPRIPINAIDFDRVRAAYGGTVPGDIYEMYYGNNSASGSSDTSIIPQTRMTARGPIEFIPQSGMSQNVVPDSIPAGQQHNTLSSPDYSSFYASPDYQFRRDEGIRDIGNSFAARGGAASGNALRALAQYNSGLAAGEFGNYFNRQAALAGVGQTATNTGIQVGQNTAANVGNLLGQAGSARASGILGQNAAYQGAIGGALDAWYNRGRPNKNGKGNISAY